jgi:NAD-dependent SIR2 family protein deacetylase
LDDLAQKLKAKKPREEEPDPKKKSKIMDMHATGEDINYVRCDYCSERFPPSDMREYNEVYYCTQCFDKIRSGQIEIKPEVNEEDSDESEENFEQSDENLK